MSEFNADSVARMSRLLRTSEEYILQIEKKLIAAEEKVKELEAENERLKSLWLTPMEAKAAYEIFRSEYIGQPQHELWISCIEQVKREGL